MITFGFFLFSISEHSFHMTAIKKLFFVRTRDETIFGTSKTSRVRFLDKNLIPTDTPKEIKDEIEMHRYIDVKNIDWIKTYFARVMWCPKCMFTKRDKFLKLYEKGQDRIDTELDIVKMMKSLRNMKILMRNSFMDEEVKYQITHSKKNLINIDTSSEDHDADEDGELTQTGFDKECDNDAPAHCASVKDTDPKAIRRKLTRSIIHKKSTKKIRPKHLHFGLEYKEAKMGILANKLMKKDGNCRTIYKHLTKEMAAIVLTRWAKRTLLSKKIKNSFQSGEVDITQMDEDKF